MEPMNSNIEHIVNTSSKVIVHQRKEWLEILSDWETRNKYEISTPTGAILGYMIERSGGLSRFITRSFMGNWRPFDIEVLTQNARRALHIQRPIFFLFPKIYIYDDRDELVGYVQKRFGLFYKKYDLCSPTGELFAHVKTPLWRVWTFPIYTGTGQAVGCISKRWQGILKEAFTDSDQFVIDFSDFKWTSQQRATLLAAAISIDFDYFENNQTR